MFLHFDLRKKRGKHEPVKPRFLVLRRRTLTLGAALLAAAAIFGAVNAPAAVRASAATRQLPIYCVERDQKVCSISFDAAWGDSRMRQCGLSKKSVKTKSSLRTLPLVGSFRDYFMQVKEAKGLNKKVCGNCYNYEYDSFVFVDEMGERMKMNYLTSAFPKFLERSKLRRTRFHDFRHIGFALKEQYSDEKKHSTMFGAGIPLCNDIPDDMEILFHVTDRPEGPQKSTGCSESFQSSGHVAVLNAIYNAVGVRIYTLPATAEKVKAGMDALAAGKPVVEEHWDLGCDFYEHMDELDRKRKKAFAAEQK